MHPNMRPYPQTRPTTANFANFGWKTPSKRPPKVTEQEGTCLSSITPINNQLDVYNLCQLKNPIPLDYKTQLDCKDPIGLHFEGDTTDCNPNP